jgi:hypothetical protein
MLTSSLALMDARIGTMLSAEPDVRRYKFGGWDVRINPTQQIKVFSELNIQFHFDTRNDWHKLRSIDRAYIHGLDKCGFSELYADLKSHMYPSQPVNGSTVFFSNTVYVMHDPINLKDSVTNETLTFKSLIRVIFNQNKYYIFVLDDAQSTYKQLYTYE